MLTLMVLFGLMMLMISLAASAARRRRLREQERRDEELARAQEDGDPSSPPAVGMSPFGLLPFGGLLEQLMSGSGGWSRSLMYDERTGQWVDVTEQPPPEAAPEGSTPPPEDPADEQRRRSAAGAAGPRLSRAEPPRREACPACSAGWEG